MFKTLKTTLVAAGMLAASASLAFAVTITQSNVIPNTPVANPLADSFGLIASAPAGATAFIAENVVGNVTAKPNQRLSPWTATLNVDDPASVFTAVSRNTEATYTLTGNAMGVISFIWGSPDTYNDLEIKLAGGGGTVTINGADPALQPIFPSPGLGRGAVLVTVTDTVGAGFESITFRSTGLPAFEFANLTMAAVPLPASLPLLFAGLGGIAFMRSRRKKS